MRSKALHPVQEDNNGLRIWYARPKASLLLDLIVG